VEDFFYRDINIPSFSSFPRPGLPDYGLPSRHSRALDPVITP